MGKIKKTKEPIKKSSENKDSYGFYNRREFINSKMDLRDVDFYIRNSSRNINIALLITIIALIFTVLKTIEINTYASRSNYHIAGVDGRVYSLNWTKDKEQKTFEAIVEIREKNRISRESK